MAQFSLEDVRGKLGQMSPFRAEGTCGESQQSSELSLFAPHGLLFTHPGPDRVYQGAIVLPCLGSGKQGQPAVRTSGHGSPSKWHGLGLLPVHGIPVCS